MAPVIDQPDYLTEWHSWRDRLEAERRDPHGFMAFSSIFLLSNEPTRAPGLPGLWSTDGNAPHVSLSDGEALTVDGATVTGEYRFAPVSEREHRRTASFGDVVIELSKRGGQDILRPIDPQQDLLDRYVSTPAYEPTTEWLVDAEFVPFEPPREQTIETVVAGLVHRYPAVGELVFELGASRQRLLIFSLGLDADPSTGLAPAFTFLTDATSGVTTYAASRDLKVAIPPAGGPTIIDFNRATNLECAYTPYSNCSIPPAQNRLSVAIEAGEKIPIIRT